jgi:hypothetical protein
VSASGERGDRRRLAQSIGIGAVPAHTKDEAARAFYSGRAEFIEYPGGWPDLVPADRDGDCGVWGRERYLGSVSSGLKHPSFQRKLESRFSFHDFVEDKEIPAFAGMTIQPE